MLMLGLSETHSAHNDDGDDDGDDNEKKSPVK